MKESLKDLNIVKKASHAKLWRIPCAKLCRRTLCGLQHARIGQRLVLPPAPMLLRLAHNVTTPQRSVCLGPAGGDRHDRVLVKLPTAVADH